MTCACQMNAEETAITQPCLAHAQWAKTYAAQTWGDGCPVHGAHPSEHCANCRRRLQVVPR